MIKSISIQMVQFLFLRRVDCGSLFFVLCSCVCFKALNKGTKSLRRRKQLVLFPALSQSHRDFVCILGKTKKSRYPNNIRSYSYYLNPNIFSIASKQSKQNLYIPKYSSSNILRSDSISSSRDFRFSSGTNSVYRFAFSRISA